MGSQNVTKFSPKRTKEIYAEISGFDPTSPLADQLVRSAGITAAGSLAKTSNFIQCLSSESTAYGLELLISLAEQLRTSRTPERLSHTLQENYGVEPGSRRPLQRIMSRMTDIMSVHVAAKGTANDAAPAARSAVTQTLIDLVEEAGQKEATDSSREEIAEAFKGVRLEKIAKLFFENVITSLVNESLEAAKQDASSTKVQVLKDEIREKFAPDFTRIMFNLAKRQGTDPVELAGKINPKLLNGIRKETGKWKRKRPAISTSPMAGAPTTEKKE